MGMDVYGRKPKSNKGGYFRNPECWWRPLAEYCIEIAPEITARCTGWQYNDGDGLNDCDSAALADVLQEEINSGRCEAYAKNRTAEIEALPNEICECCDGAGVLSEQWIKGAKRFADNNHDLSEIFGPPPDFKVGDKCHGCEGTGTRRPLACEDSFAVENVQEFVTFLRSCGGFSIW